MKFVCTFLIAFSFFMASAQTSIPEGTTVPLITKEQVDVNNYKVGSSAPFVVAEDVKVNGVVVFPANAKVHAVVTKSSKSGAHKGEGDLRIDFLDVMAMDGSTVKLSDCWLFTNGAQNLNKHLPMFPAGTRKNCHTVRQ